MGTIGRRALCKKNWKAKVLANTCSIFNGYINHVKLILYLQFKKKRFNDNILYRNLLLNKLVSKRVNRNN